MKVWFVLLLLAAPVFAEPSTDDPDAPFYMKATRGGLAEIDGGLLAQQRSKNPDVLAFAAMVAKDHTAANAQLRELAVVNHVDLPTALNAEQLTKKSQLTALTGNDFDRSYIEWQILAHKDAIELFREESESGDDKDARQFAIDTLPILRSHLAKLFAMPMIASAPATTPDSAAR